jgi:hypothetical protein
MSLLHGSETLLTIAQQMKDAGVNAVSIALMTSCPEQYNQLMSPKQQQGGLVCDISSSPLSSPSSSSPSTSTHERVCQFITQCIDVGLDVEVTGVKHDFVNEKEAEALATVLGVTKSFRWRSFSTL